MEGLVQALLEPRQNPRLSVEWETRCDHWWGMWLSPSFPPSDETKPELKTPHAKLLTMPENHTGSHTSFFLRPPPPGGGKGSPTPSPAQDPLGGGDPHRAKNCAVLGHLPTILCARAETHTRACRPLSQCCHPSFFCSLAPELLLAEVHQRLFEPQACCILIVQQGLGKEANGWDSRGRCSGGGCHAPQALCCEHDGVLPHDVEVRRWPPTGTSNRRPGAEWEPQLLSQPA